MGFGFNLFSMFILIPITGILLILWLLTRNKKIGKFLVKIWMGVLVLILLSITANWLTSKEVLDKKDYYGEYIINRDYFSGKQSDWQYNHYRFKILKNDSLYFYITNNERIIKMIKGKIAVTNKDDYESQRLIINLDYPTHHILSSNPTTYRSSWSFYLVFNSPKFNNVFFKKGKWEKLVK